MKNNNKNLKHADAHGKMAHKAEAPKAAAETSKAGQKAEAPKAAGHKAEAKTEKSEAKEEDRAKSAECGCKYF